LFYWGLDDTLDLVVILLNAGGIYLAYEITRITKGAPRGWYFVIIAFGVFLVFRASQLYFDTQTPSDTINIIEAVISIVAWVFLITGLYLLNASFRRRLKTAETS
jgi:vacuolar-type H+-ATPase subunit I/STV1